MLLAAALSQPTEYERAIDFIDGRETVAAQDLKAALDVSGSVAKGFIAKMVEAGLLTPPNDVGRCLVVAAMDREPGADVASEPSGDVMSEAAALSVAIDGALRAVGDDSGEVMSGQVQGRLRSLVERIQRLNDDKADIGRDISEVYEEAKGAGFDTKILRRVVRHLAADKVKRMEDEAVMDLYLAALGETR